MDYNQKQNIPTNAEIIDELTKDLESSIIKDANDENKTFNDSTENDEKNRIHNSNLESDDKNDNTATVNDEELDEYFVNENSIRNRDLTLTDQDKQTYRTEAEDHKKKGNDSFRNGDYENATTYYTDGLTVCPLEFTKDRAVLYANRAAAKTKFQTDKKSAIIDCTKAITLDEDYVKVYLRRAQLYKETDKLDEALADYKKVLVLDPLNNESICAISILERMINDRNEKMKEEMMSKMKDLGNMILKPFGLSTNNFQMQKDEQSGSYSVKFVNNPQ